MERKRNMKEEAHFAALPKDFLCTVPGDFLKTKLRLFLTYRVSAR